MRNLYLLLIMGAYLKHHRNKRVPITTLSLCMFNNLQKKKHFCWYKGREEPYLSFYLDMFWQIHWKVKISYAHVHIVIDTVYQVQYLDSDLMCLCSLSRKKQRKNSKKQVKYGYISSLKLKWSCIKIPTEYVL